MDNKISFISGFMFTTLSTITIMGVAQAAMIGLVGGFSFTGSTINESGREFIYMAFANQF